MIASGFSYCGMQKIRLRFTKRLPIVNSISLAVSECLISFQIQKELPTTVVARVSLSTIEWGKFT